MLEKSPVKGKRWKNHKVVEWFQWEGTLRDLKYHLLPPPATGRDIIH